MLSDFYWLPPQIPTVQLKQIERAMHGTGERAMAADQVEHGQTALVANDGLTVDQAGANRQFTIAIAMNGNREEKSLPERVISRTPAPSRRAMMRKPSCLISCSQPEPLGGALAADGRHGSIKPSSGVGNTQHRCLLKRNGPMSRVGTLTIKRTPSAGRSGS